MTNKPQLITLGLFTTITDDGQKTGLLDLSPYSKWETITLCTESIHHRKDSPF